jgi:hypothetical protein
MSEKQNDHRNKVTIAGAEEVFPSFRQLQAGDVFSFPTTEQFYMKLNKYDLPRELETSRYAIGYTDIGFAVQLETGRIYTVKDDHKVRIVVPGAVVQIKR